MRDAVLPLVLVMGQGLPADVFQNQVCACPQIKHLLCLIRRQLYRSTANLTSTCCACGLCLLCLLRQWQDKAMRDAVLLLMVIIALDLPADVFQNQLCVPVLRNKVRSFLEMLPESQTCYVSVVRLLLFVRALAWCFLSSLLGSISCNGAVLGQCGLDNVCTWVHCETCAGVTGAEGDFHNSTRNTADGDFARDAESTACDAN